LTPVRTTIDPTATIEQLEVNLTLDDAFQVAGRYNYRLNR
jgi:hypothetical protein